MENNPENNEVLDQNEIKQEDQTELEVETETSENLREEVSDEISEVEERTEISENVEEEIEEEPEKKEPEIPEEKKEDKPKDKPSKKKIFAIVGIVVIAIVILIILFALIYNPTKANNFEYNHFKFEKIPFGGIYLYETNLTFLDNGKPVDFNVRLRNDPRKLDQIPVNFSRISKTVYFAFPEKTLNCSSDSLIAAFQIGQYLGNLGFSVVPAVTENFTGNTLPVINCSNLNKSKGAVILEPFSGQDRIYQENENCIVLQAKNCSVVEVSERFILAVLEKIRSSK